MLRALTTLENMAIRAVDGDIGSVKDVYFDDHSWTVRYLVIDTGKWLPGRKVLISPLAVRAFDEEERHLHVSLRQEQVRSSPNVDTDLPVSRQHEIAYFDHYGYPYYWAGPLRWGPVPFPQSVAGDSTEADTLGREALRTVQRHKSDPHLRSVKAVTGYHIDATDGSIGHVEDFLYEERDWALRFLIVDTRNWLPGRHVIVSIDWVEAVSWDQRKLTVNLTRDAVRESPEWRPDAAEAGAGETSPSRSDARGVYGQPPR